MSERSWKSRLSAIHEVRLTYTCQLRRLVPYLDQLPPTCRPPKKPPPSISESRRLSPRLRPNLSPVAPVQGRKTPLNIPGSKRRRHYGSAGIRSSSNKRGMRSKREESKKNAYDRKRPPIKKLLHGSSRRTALNKKLPWLRRRLRYLVASLRVCETSVVLLSIVF